MAEICYQKGEIVYRAGDRGDCFYQVLEGSVDVVLNWDKERSTTLTSLQPGQFFGEMSALGGYPRSATVVAAADGTRLMELTEKDMNHYFSEKPETILSLMQYLGDRIRTLSGDYQQACAVLEEMKAVNAKPANDTYLDKFKRAVTYYFGTGRPKNRPSLEALSARNEHQGTLEERVFSFREGSVLYREGEPGRCMYCVQWGRVGIYSNYGTNDQRKLTELSVNEFFGEMGMLNNEPRSATAVILEEGTTLETIYLEDLQELFRKNPLKVWMVLEHIGMRLRHLTEDYAKVCREICERS